eukprot:15480699-Alexandrium_andersonii.AAC.1
MASEGRKEGFCGSPKRTVAGPAAARRPAAKRACRGRAWPQEGALLQESPAAWAAPAPPPKD